MNAFALIAQRRIEASIERGDFDDLPLSGKPVDLEEYFKTPAEVRMAWTILKNANLVPHEVELSREIEELRHEIAATGADANEEDLAQRLREKILELQVVLERRRP